MGAHITVLRANINDTKNIWEWRNDELTKKMSVTPDKLNTASIICFVNNGFLIDREDNNYLYYIKRSYKL